MLKKITESDINGLGVVGLADTPGLSATDMQEKFEEISKSAIIPKFNQLIDDLEALNIYHKVDSVEGKGLSTNDYTNEDKEALYSTKGKIDETVKIFGKASIDFGRKPDTYKGDKSTALGSDNTASGNYSDALGQDNISSGLASHSEGANNISSGKYSHAEGNKNEATKDYAHAEGYITKATGVASHAEGDHTTAGAYSHAEGYLTTAMDFSHSEGDSTTASGVASHSEGSETQAIGLNSHSEGKLTVASGKYSHAEGSGTRAKGSNAHAEGGATIATGEFQHVQGKFNEEDADGIYAHIVGGGTSDTDRKNIHTIDWHGNAEFAGNVTDGYGNSISLLKTESGHSLELNIDENYIMTISLLNKSGETISSKAIDFPVESMVVNASYSSGKLTLVLQNGNMVDVDVSAIVKGLVNESRTIAGIDLKDDITADELIAALGVDVIKNDVAQLKGDLDYQNENVSNGEGKIFEYIAGRSHVTDYDRSLCTISAEVPKAMYGNGFTADDDLLLTKIHINANTIRVLVNTIDSPYDWTVYSDVSVTDGVANVSIPVKKGQSVFVGWQDGTVQYSPNISGFECVAYMNYDSSASKITINALASFNLEYSYYDKTEWYDIKRLVDKNELIWLAIGDSITLGATNNDVSYVDYIREKININVIKEGHSGWTLDRLMQNFSSFDTENTADIITIFAGTNDFNVSAGAGSESDKYSISCATIWALCNFAMPYLQKRYPTKPIIFFTPLQRKYTNSHGYPQEMNDDNGVTLREYAQAFIDAGKKYGIPVIDLYSISGISVNNINDMTNDGLHPNEIGQKRIANIILSEIMKYTQIN